MTTIAERIDNMEKAKMIIVAKYMLEQGLKKEEVLRVTGLSEEDLSK